MKRQIVLTLWALLALFVQAPLAASEAFNSAVEDARTQDDERGSTSSGAGTGGASTVSDGVASGAAELFVELLALAWLHNLGVRYAPYPYCYEGEKALVWESLSDGFYSGEFRLRRFSFDTSAVYLGDLGLGNESRIECTFLPFLGVRTEHLLLCETARNPDITGCVCTSVQVPLFQTNPLSSYIDLGAAFWYGDVHPLLQDGGFLFGFELRSYPFKPLALRWRLAGQSFDDDVNIATSSLEVGCMINRWEVFAAWKYLSVSNSDRDEPEADWHGIAAGARVYW